VEQRDREGVTGAPVWLRAAVALGVPSVIALFLVYVLTMALASRLAAIEVTQHRLERELQTVCLMVATSDEQRARCVVP
jgi:hypothetical protein